MEVKSKTRFLDDVQSLRAIIEGMPREDRQDYESYTCRSKEVGFPNRYFVIYTLSGGIPEQVEMWQLGGISMDRVRGPEVELTAPDGSQISVGITPKRIGARDVYMHVPQSFELKWKGKATPKGVHFVPQYAVLIKTRSREHAQVDGDTYCVTLNKFRERFPGVNIGY